MTKTRTRNVRGIAAFLLIVLVGSVTGIGTASGQSTRSRLNEAERRYRQLQSELDRVADIYWEKHNELDDTLVKISATTRRIRQLEDRHASMRKQLKDRVRTAYRMGGLGFVNFLLSADSFRDFSLRVVLLERQAAQDEELILDLKRVQGEVMAERRVLENQKAIQARQVADVGDQKENVESALARQESLYNELRERFRAEQLAALLRVGHRHGSVSGRAIPLQACPAGGPHSFSNDWGAPRSGGRRHQGNDILAPHGSPSLAVVSGRITRLRSGGLGGLALYLWGDDNNEYYYAHMSGFAVSQGERVSAGQTIAYVGNTGNARGGPPHIHFEIHPGGGGPINPYPSLVRVC